jgi:hypothetical protein
MNEALFSTAYLPPCEYIARIAAADYVLIEREENYVKQSYRNRCYILSPHGVQLLTVPVLLGSIHKTPLKEIRIDYSKRWQQVHLRAMIAAYNSSPYFQYYFEDIERIISKKHAYLIDLNARLIESILKILKIKKELNYSIEFKPIGPDNKDFRYSLSPKRESEFTIRKYYQVFDIPGSRDNRLSILDLIFNLGPESVSYL